MGKIQILVEPPGPKAREIIERDSKVLMQSYVRWLPLVIKAGEGATVIDVDGNRYIDMNAGIAVLATGHRHPMVIEAIKKQLDKFLHYSLTDFYYEEAVILAERLTSILPGDKVFFTNSGAEAIEGAMKVSRGYFKGARNYFIAFIGSFHGRTLGALSLTASKPVHRKWFSPLISTVIHVPYPYCFRCPFKMNRESCNLYCLEFIEEWVFNKYVPSEEVSAIFIEPIQGEGGYIPAPRDFIIKLRKLADKYGILLVADEVQCGMGRTGKWLAIQNYGVNPDIVALAKGIASGLPLGAIVGRKEVMNLPPGSHATTFGGNPVSIAASLTTIKLLEEGLMENARKQGEYLIKRLLEFKDKYEIVGDVRGLGLMIGMEIVEKDGYTPSPKKMRSIMINSFKRGVLVIGAGTSTLRFSPPLNISREEIDEALEIIEDEIKKASK